MASGREYVVDISSREPSFDPPSYAISHGKDYTLKWEPPAGSKDLTVALSYHFPLETSMESKMRASTKKFLKEEKRKQSKAAVPTNALAPVEESTVEDTAFRALASDLISQRQSEPNKDNEVAVLSADTLGALPEAHLSSSIMVKEKEPGTKEPPNDETLVASSSNVRTLASTSVQQELEHDKVRHHTIEQTGSMNGSGVASTKTYPPDATLSAVVEQPTGPQPGLDDEVPQRLSWVNGLEQKEVKRKKRRYGTIEAAEVAANRGNACEEHRKRKCDPDSCANNGLRLYQSSKLSKESILVQTNTPQIEQKVVSSVTSTKATEGGLVTGLPPSINTSLGTSEPHDRSIAPEWAENSLDNDSLSVFGLGLTPLPAPSGNAFDSSKKTHQIDTDDAVPSEIARDDLSESLSGPFDPPQCSNEFPGWPTDQAGFGSGSGWGSGCLHEPTYMDDQFATDVPDAPSENRHPPDDPSTSFLTLDRNTYDTTMTIDYFRRGADFTCDYDELFDLDIPGPRSFLSLVHEFIFDFCRAKITDLNTTFADLSFGT
ncbi:hypothetical protein DL95DRAFT_468532 [Leptodontidium sp. 2 PMI_412]|nr:hypothetical protein DL95DRAFT_468532 [Leptodontidium sp. 2 PMI_412]